VFGDERFTNDGRHDTVEIGAPHNHDDPSSFPQRAYSPNQWKENGKRERRNYATARGTASRNECINLTLPYCVRRYQWKRTNSELRSAARRTREGTGEPRQEQRENATTSFDVIVTDDRGRRGGGGSQTVLVCVMTQTAVKSTQSSFTRAHVVRRRTELFSLCRCLRHSLSRYPSAIS
jgi:hypothetical protein